MVFHIRCSSRLSAPSRNRLTSVPCSRVHPITPPRHLQQHVASLRQPISVTITQRCKCSSSVEGQKEADDQAIADELMRLSDPDRVKKMARHLELVWMISKVGKGIPETCTSCVGSAEIECRWCNATGFLMLGDTMYAYTGTRSNKCPVCKGTGYCKCEHCRGTGKRASWLPSIPTPAPEES